MRIWVRSGTEIVRRVSDFQGPATAPRTPLEPRCFAEKPSPLLRTIQFQGARPLTRRENSSRARRRRLRERERHRPVSTFPPARPVPLGFASPRDPKVRTKSGAEEARTETRRSRSVDEICRVRVREY